MLCKCVCMHACLHVCGCVKKNAGGGEMRYSQIQNAYIHACIHTYMHTHRGRRRDMVKSTINDIARSEHVDLRVFDHQVHLTSYTKMRNYWSIQKAHKKKQYTDSDSDSETHHKGTHTSENGIMFSKEESARKHPIRNSDSDSDTHHNSKNS